QTHFKSSSRDDMKSLWNWGSMTCIMCFTWLVSHLSISSSRANSRSGPLHVYYFIDQLSLKCHKNIKTDILFYRESKRNSRSLN
uniref:Uncharacterized protein n=1 Tax=Anabas testudineus TaxID=64144 RepID=A0A3Q1J3R2_ANATE